MSELRQNKFWKNIDTPTIVLYLVLVLIGWLSIYSAVYDESHRSIFDIEKNYGKQLIWILSAFFIAFMIITIESKFFSVFSYGIYGGTLVLLVAVLFFGKYVNGSRSWFEIGSFRLQPAEFAKFATALVIAKYISTTNKKLKDMRTISVSLGILFLPMALILLQGDVGSAVSYVAFVFVLYREGLSGFVLVFGVLLALIFILALLFPPTNIYIGITIASTLAYLYFRKKKYAFTIIVIATIMSISMVAGFDYTFNHVLKSHHRDRLNNLVGKEIDLKGAGYNVNQSKIAIGSGGFTGKGYLNGTQTKYDFVPEQSTDFIFCTVGEEFGFAGSLALIGLFTALLLRIIFLAERQRSAFSRIYAYGVASILFMHLTINIGMTIGLVPVIGIPLPFVSYGGSSLWSFTILLFILIKLDSNRQNIIR
ncbi:MAG: rod shape-determining protein RodA [Sphingobacteriales bacterium]|jgi:rod shape determining protein RodA|nr:rod shape-determining protein RodA [Sphingobacteriales bacterium]